MKWSDSFYPAAINAGLQGSMNKRRENTPMIPFIRGLCGSLYSVMGFPKLLFFMLRPVAVGEMKGLLVRGILYGELLVCFFY